MVIERIRQFYDAPRCFRIDGPNNQQQFVTFDNDALQMQGDGMEFGVEIAGRMPVFDIMVRPQKASPFSKIAQNELAKELYGMGVFNPEYADQAYACIDMMDFEGKDTVMQRIQENGMMYQQIQQLQHTLETVEYKCWFYEAAKAAGTVDVPGAMTDADVPERFRAIRQELRGQKIPNSER